MDQATLACLPMGSLFSPDVRRHAASVVASGSGSWAGDRRGERRLDGLRGCPPSTAARPGGCPQSPGLVAPTQGDDLDGRAHASCPMLWRLLGGATRTRRRDVADRSPSLGSAPMCVPVMRLHVLPGDHREPALRPAAPPTARPPEAPVPPQARRVSGLSTMDGRRRP
jgi:hypothetical protein